MSNRRHRPGRLRGIRETATWTPWRKSFAEDAVWVTSDELPLGGEVKGRDAIMGNFAQIPNYWTSFSVEPEEFIDAGE